MGGRGVLAGVLGRAQPDDARQRTFYTSNPSRHDPRDDTASWSFADPASQGLSARALGGALRALRTRPREGAVGALERDLR